MPAYMIFIRKQPVSDNAEMEKYREGALPTLDLHPVDLLSRYAPVEVLEGNPVDAVLISKFPDRNAALRWYHSDTYQAAKAHRVKAADYHVILTGD